MNARTEWFRFLSGNASNERKKVGRVTSPYDVPEAFRVSAVGDGRISLEFRYLDRAEPSRAVNLASDVKVEIGKSTNRLLMMEFRPSDHNVDELIPKIHRIIQQLSEQVAFRNQAEWNYRATREAVDSTLPHVSDRLASVFFPAPAH